MHPEMELGKMVLSKGKRGFPGMGTLPDPGCFSGQHLEVWTGKVTVEQSEPVLCKYAPANFQASPLNPSTC